MTPDFTTALGSGIYWLMVLLTLGLVGAAVGLHYEALERLNHSMPNWRLPPRLRILALIISILSLHISEIWLFGGGIWLIAQNPELGSVSGVAELKLLDAVYLSTTTFTTVGYGDLTPHGPLRLVLGSEALTGFVLVTWSASFTYLEMQRFWRPHAH
jgi:ABC-type glucose/galactose transport system permease subunit